MRGQYLGAGAAAGAVSRSATAPLERLKIFNQVFARLFRIVCAVACLLACASCRSFAAARWSTTVLARGARARALLAQIRGISKDAARYNGIWKSLALMYREEGVRGFFKGNGTNCVKVVPASAIRFVSFENYKKVRWRLSGFFVLNRLAHSVLAHTLAPMHVDRWLAAPTSQLLLLGSDKNLTTTRKMLAGSAAGVTSVLFTYPLDLVRTRLSVQTSEKHYDGMLDAFRKIWRRDGARGFFKGAGTAITVGRQHRVWAARLTQRRASQSVAPFAAVNFTVYETLKELGADRIASKSVFLSAGYGAVSGSIAMTSAPPARARRAVAQVARAVLYPLDVLKRRLQVQGHG